MKTNAWAHDITQKTQLAYVKVRRLLSSITYKQDADFHQLRSGPYGAIFVEQQNEDMEATNSGNYYAATTTPSSSPVNPSWTVTSAGLQFNASGGGAAAWQKFNPVNAVLVMRNTLDSDVVVYPHFIRITYLTQPNIATSQQFALAITNVNRLSTGGTELKPYNTCTTCDGKSVVDIRAGNVTTTVAVPTVTAGFDSEARYLARWTYKTETTPCIAVGDQHTIWFGHGGGSGGALGGSSTSAAGADFVAPGVALGRGYSTMLLHAWQEGVGVTPCQVDISVGWYER